MIKKVYDQFSMLSLFKPSPLLDQATADWIIECSIWSIHHFDSEEFFLRSKLIKPTNEFFPGQVSSIHEKADNIFQHTLNHAGLSHWAFHLVPPETYTPPVLQPSGLSEIKRNSSDQNDGIKLNNIPIIDISYNPHQTLKAGDLASTFAHILAQHLCVHSQNPPPGGQSFFMEGTEVLAIMMGFGILMANSAYTYRGGCGSCHNPYANRQANLSEHEVTFTLAVFCYLKNIPQQEALPHLKKHLRKAYKSATHQLNDYAEVLDKIKETSLNKPGR